MIFDECHRSQFGDMHKRITSKFKKYYIFGFTGTPIFAQNSASTKTIVKTTEQVFGDKLHTYTIVNAINDKNVLPFNVDFVQRFTAKGNIRDEKVKAINTEKAFMAPESINLVAEYIVNQFATKTNTNESYIFNSLDNVKAIAKNNKAKEKKSPRSLNGFNSIFAVSSIAMAKAYYQAFKNNVDHNSSYLFLCF